MKKIVACGVTILLFVGCGISSKTHSKKVADVTMYLNIIDAKDLSKHLYTIASNEMAGRDTGSEGQKKAGEYLINQYKALGIQFPKGASSYYQNVPAEFMTKNFGNKGANSENIWAYIPGSTYPNEIIVISAHYDHIGIKNDEIYNGADDDASGTVALLEIAQAFAKAKSEGWGPKRSILFLHVTAEEKGLHGSRYYVENPLFPLKNTVVDINIDMIGRIDPEHVNNPNYVYVIGSDRLSTELHQINEEMNTRYIGLNLDYKYNDRNDPELIYFRSDHYNFAKNRIPSIFFFNGVHEDYHKPSDTPDKINYELLTKRTQLAFVNAWEIANRDKRIIADKNGE
ncbi:MAG TPA: peptidase M28 [Flavobacterium sp.]|nr:peptidase M28 [Flavobacterium sp.]